MICMLTSWVFKRLLKIPLIEMSYITFGGGVKRHWAPPRGRSGGIIVGVNLDSLDVLHVKNEDYFVRMLVCDKKIGFTWSFITIYGDAQPDKRLISLLSSLEFMKGILLLVYLG